MERCLSVNVEQKCESLDALFDAKRLYEASERLYDCLECNAEGRAFSIPLDDGTCVGQRSKEDIEDNQGGKGGISDRHKCCSQLLAKGGVR